jgi:hypothetical protein
MTIRGHRRTGFRIAIVAALLALAPSAHAATPRPGATYSGTTSQAERATLKVARSGKTLALTVSWTAACQSGGVLRSSTVSKRIRVSRTGRFSRRGSYATTVGGHVVHVDLRLTGRFTSTRRASGTLGIHAHVDGVDDHCHVDGARWTVRRR